MVGMSFQNTSKSISKDILKNAHLSANLENEKLEIDKRDLQLEMQVLRMKQWL